MQNGGPSCVKPNNTVVDSCAAMAANTSCFLQSVYQKKLEKVDAKLKQKQEKRAQREQEVATAGSKGYVLVVCV